LFCFFITLTFTVGCRKEATLFTRLSPNETGIDFNNELKEDDPAFSILNYPYFYNGGGVGIGDINNDGLPDIIFTGNMVKNKVYLNKGDFEFEDISEKSGIVKHSGWNTGVTLVDINADGWLDIYICRSGLPNASDRSNLLYINNHDLTFTESASRVGLNDAGYSTQASFFDYDRDGDLDMFLINQSEPKYMRGFLDFLQTRSQKADSTLSNKLFRNDNGHFSNVSNQAGIQSSVFTFSLGISTTDINQDGWPDIYVANDFEEADYLYINNRDGTFTDRLASMVDHTSLFSMGMDVADYNNDLLPDYLVLDMFPEDNHAQKMHINADNFSRTNYMFSQGMFPQYMKNTLQKNNGDGTFSEIAQIAGVSATDWSWSPLVADYDNDGLKDLFITNGYKRDNTDMQFMAYAMDVSTKIQQGGKAASVSEYISHMAGIHLPNYIFKNDGGDHFSNKIKEWGFDEPTFSHGGSYSDLDNDGDLDLITNNTDSFAGVYRNNSEDILGNSFLKIKLEGLGKNVNGIGAKVYVYSDKDKYYIEQSPVRGYQSSVGLELQLGLGKHKSIDSLRVIWPDQANQLIINLAVNKSITLFAKDALMSGAMKNNVVPLFQETRVIDFSHRENDENDFTNQFLLPHFYSRNSPCLARGDVNGDSLTDIFVGGAIGQSGEIFLQSKDHKFSRMHLSPFGIDAESEDMDAAFFDCDGDKDLDLYVVSGGYEFEEGSPELQDRLYINNGRGVFSKSPGKLPKGLFNKKSVRPNDIDGDGDIDLFVGGHVVPGNFPLSFPSKIYFNDGQGNFSTIKPGNAPLGIVNDACWIDLNLDGKKDLVVASEWQPLRAYLTEGILFQDVTALWFPDAGLGLWNCLATDDFDKDGDIDVVVGNFGKNSPLSASEVQPIQLFYSDIDSNGSTDPLMTHFIQGKSVPFAMRDDVIAQLPMLKKKFNDYTSYANATIGNILTPEQTKSSPKLMVNTLQTSYFENTGKTFVKKSFPIEAQFSSIHAMVATDLNGDGHSDLVMAGNNQWNRIYIGRQDANHGMVFLGDGKGGFNYLPQPQSGLNIKGDVRSILVDGKAFIFGINNEAVRSYKIN
jgi:enediyne biosynthesis protein E4